VSEVAHYVSGCMLNAAHSFSLSTAAAAADFDDNNDAVLSQCLSSCVY